MTEATEKLVKIAIVGPESTGKSTIAEALARHYDTIVVSPERPELLPPDLHKMFAVFGEIPQRVIHPGQVDIHQ